MKDQSQIKMNKNYDHKKYEDQIYQDWEKSGAFAPKGNGKPFSIIMPPPNANDPLHVGHAMFVALEDIMIRYHRMLGDATLWLPGTDHAGIETQFVFEKKLAKQGQSRFDFDRDTLYQMIWNYVQENSGVAIEQMKKLGASADWSQYKFTLDPAIVSQVYETFIRLHQDGLIYRDLKLVNYCTKCGTSYSELEIDHVEEDAKLYYIKYGPFVLATTRPETKFADTAVAVHPKDKRYTNYIGQEIEVDGLLGKFKLKVIADEYVDPEFGTGVVKITPYHDFNDYEVWQRHKNDIPTPKQVIGLDGKLTEVAGKYAGLRIKAARESIEKDLQEKGLLEKVENYHHTVAVCYKCGTIIEPLPLPQFFVKVAPLAQKALTALDSGETQILGAGQDKILRHWLTNLKDWNISRQIVWGIRIPVWYKPNADYVVSLESPGADYTQETDTFDTWFSSGQWPVLTLKAIGEFAKFYPTSVMETAYDILIFWVMRMMLLGIYLTGKSPFAKVYLHGLVRDEKGQKMSKSKGNVINPLAMVEKYGADAVRIALVIGSTPAQDKSVGENTIRGMRNFSNKIWNAARFVSEFANESENNSYFRDWYSKFIPEVMTRHLENLRIGQAAELIYGEFWHNFCDKFIEQAKKGEIGARQMKEGLIVMLKLLHPFMPFVTEAVWQELKLSNKMLIEESWPTA